jgi:hypothetical protein
MIVLPTVVKSGQNANPIIAGQIYVHDLDLPFYIKERNAP